MIVRNKVRPLCATDRRVLRRVLNTSGQFTESLDDTAAALKLPRRTVENSLSRLCARGILVRVSRQDASGHRLPAVWEFGSPEGVDEMVNGQLLTDLRRRLKEKPNTTPIVVVDVGMVLGKPNTTPISTSLPPSIGQNIKHIEDSTVTSNSSAITYVGMVFGKNCQSDPPGLAALRQQLAEAQEKLEESRKRRDLGIVTWGNKVSQLNREIAAWK